MAAERDLYVVLGVARDASDAEIKRAFRKLAQQTHPDVNANVGADARFKEINEAYQVLSDPQRRQAYDMFGTTGVGGDQGGFAGGAGFGNFSDIFDAFFGGAQGSAPSRKPFGGSKRRSSSPSWVAARRARGAAPSRALSRSPATSAAGGGRSGRPAGRCSARWSM